ncbi:MAG: hypothetical protein A2234_02515 [Elusimicrobia bacterium RIFOXYA2_FULL_58_8]|nr:MAG: hypothetical protein A2285_04205 [Elusimicrobia bacterium RIFOXYA12_FULL_57_11]OGS13182.1 MAG: hypothetical protein A2234_02515 [Elusimicrobia bacterium RIFOXYA2_FULL_58_8]
MKIELLSIIVPLYNEQEVLAELASRCLASGEAAGCSVELLLVDDASGDNTPVILKGLASDPRVRVLRLDVNHGQFGATREGLRQMRGDWAVVLDGDLQDPPEKIIDLVRRLDQVEDGETVVFAVKTKRNEGIWFRTGNLVYRWALGLLGASLPAGAGSYCLMSRSMAQNMAAVGVRTANLAAVLSALGARCVCVPYEKLGRYDGRSRVGWAGLILEAFASLVIVSPLGRRLLRAHLRTAP